MDRTRLTGRLALSFLKLKSKPFVKQADGKVVLTINAFFTVT